MLIELPQGWRPRVFINDHQEAEQFASRLRRRRDITQGSVFDGLIEDHANLVIAALVKERDKIASQFGEGPFFGYTDSKRGQLLVRLRQIDHILPLISEIIEE